MSIKLYLTLFSFSCSRSQWCCKEDRPVRVRGLRVHQPPPDVGWRVRVNAPSRLPRCLLFNTAWLNVHRRTCEHVYQHQTKRIPDDHHPTADGVAMCSETLVAKPISLCHLQPLVLKSTFFLRFLFVYLDCLFFLFLFVCFLIILYYYVKPHWSAYLSVPSV